MRFYVPALEKGQFSEYLGAAWRMQHLRGLLVVGLALGGIVFLLAIGQASLVPLGIASLAIAVVTSYGTFMDGLQNAARQRAVVALHQGAGAWLKIGCAALLVTLASVSTASVLWGFALAATVVMGSQYVFYRRMTGRASQSVARTNAADLKHTWYRSMTSCAWPYVIWSVPVWLQFSSDRWALEWFTSSAEVGAYAALSLLAFLPINTLTQLVTQFAMPILFARAGDLTDRTRMADSRSLNTKLVLIAGSWTIIVVAVVAYLQVPLGRLLLDARYHDYLHLLPLMVLASGLFATTQLAELNVITANQTPLLIWPKSVVAVVACAAYLAGACFGGVAGVIWACVITKTGMLAWILRIDQRLLLSIHPKNRDTGEDDCITAHPG
jgi:hypothetical protein